MNSTPSPTMPDTNIFASSSSYVLEIDTKREKSSISYAEISKSHSDIEWQSQSKKSASTSKKNRTHEVYAARHLRINGVGLAISFIAFATTVFLHALPFAVIAFMLVFGFFEMLITVIVDKKTLA